MKCKKVSLLLFLGCLTLMQVKAQSQATPVVPKSQKLIDQLVGHWLLSQIYDGTKEVDTSRYKDVMRQIVFTENAKYVSANPKLDSGYFRTDESGQLLYLENAMGDHEKTREWDIKLDNEKLVLSRKVPAKMKRYKHVYVRMPLEEKARK